MALGLSTANLAHKWLTVLSGTSFTGVSVFVKLHTGDPGASGTANASAETTRKAVTFAAPSGGSMAMSNTPSWTWTAANETITHVSLWDAASGGNFLWSGQLAASKSVSVDDILNLTSLTLGVGPQAA